MVQGLTRCNRGYTLRFLSLISFGVFAWRSIVHTMKKDIGNASHEINNLLIPADEFFSILGPIYFGLVVFIVREFLYPSKRLQNMYIVHLFFIASCPCVTIWMELFSGGHNKVAFIAMFSAWLLLFGAYLYVENNIEPIVVTSLLASSNANHQYQSTSRLDFWTIRTPFTLFWAWTCAAATVSLNILIEEYGIHEIILYIFWCGLWLLANIIILVGVGDLPFAFVGEWVLIGIAIENHRQRSKLILPTITDTTRYGETYVVEAIAAVGAFVFAGLFCFLVIHYFWRGISRANATSPSTGIPLQYGTSSV